MNNKEEEVYFKLINSNYHNKQEDYLVADLNKYKEINQ
jgi:hypothetical protein